MLVIKHVIIDEEKINAQIEVIRKSQKQSRFQEDAGNYEQAEQQRTQQKRK